MKNKPTMEYIEQKAEEMKKAYLDTGCAPIKQIFDAWDDRSIPNESIKLYSDFIHEEVLPKRREKFNNTQPSPHSKLIEKMTPLERIALDFMFRQHEL